MEDSMNKKVVLIIASDGFQPKEYGNTKKILEDIGIEVVTVSDKMGQAVDAFGQEGPDVLLIVDQVKPEEYDGIFLIGGAGALKCLDKEGVYDLMRKARDMGLCYGAICISPRILCKAGIITSGQKITGWNGDGKLKDECAQADVLLDKDVVVDGKLITSKDPETATAFGKAIAKALKS